MADWSSKTEEPIPPMRLRLYISVYERILVEMTRQQWREDEGRAKQLGHGQSTIDESPTAFSLAAFAHYPATSKAEPAIRREKPGSRHNRLHWPEPPFKGECRERISILGQRGYS